MALVEASRFPTELVLDVIERLKFGDGSDIVNLSLTHSRFKNVLRSYEHSIAKTFAQKELRHAHVDFPTKQQGFRWLRECDQQYNVVDDLMAMLVSEHNVFPVRKHNMAMVNTGILLLYRLQSFGRSLWSEAIAWGFVLSQHAQALADYVNCIFVMWLTPRPQHPTTQGSSS